MVRIGIAGVAGRMGRLLAEEARGAGAELAGGIDKRADPPGSDVTLFSGIAELARASDIVLDFTHASAAQSHAAALAEAGTAWILGTTGLSDEDESAVATAARRIPIVYAANFAPGVNLVLAIAVQIGHDLRDFM